MIPSCHKSLQSYLHLSSFGSPYFYRRIHSSIKWLVCHYFPSAFLTSYPLFNNCHEMLELRVCKLYFSGLFVFVVKKSLWGLKTRKREEASVLSFFSPLLFIFSFSVFLFSLHSPILAVFLKVAKLLLESKFSRQWLFLCCLNYCTTCYNDRNSGYM